MHGLGDINRRREHALLLARKLGAEEIIVFVADPELRFLLPAPGFPRTLPKAREWRAFLQACLKLGRHSATLTYPDAQSSRMATGFGLTDGSVAILLGGQPDLVATHSVCLLLPMLTPAFRNEQMARIASTQAQTAREAATQIRTLAEALDRTKRDLQRALVEADEALRARDEFLSVAAHELRTPVTGLRGYSQLLIERIRRQANLDPAALAEALKVIDQRSEKLARLVTRLLDISRLEAGKLTIERTRVDLGALATEVAASTGKTTSHTIIVHAEAGLLADIDSLRVEQVIINLLDNAMRYSPAGSAIDVEVSRHSPETLAISVRDRGAGIAHKDQSRVFERFFQSRHADQKSGMGLGLYISKQIVDLHGGQIAVTSPADGGTRFVVTLPTWSEA
ncbi:MAG TPA: ATP-binding protein [Chloroflexota bacterium]|nr:ATP-binding protein [Chloroflexota bacterium]